MQEHRQTTTGLSLEAYYQQVGKNVPVGRIAEAEEVADLIAFLVSKRGGIYYGHGYQFRRWCERGSVTVHQGAEDGRAYRRVAFIIDRPVRSADTLQTLRLRDLAIHHDLSWMCPTQQPLFSQALAVACCQQ